MSRIFRRSAALSLLLGSLIVTATDASSIRYTATDLGAGLGLSNAVGYGMSDNGHIVGRAWNDQAAVTVNFTYYNGAYTDLGTTWAFAVNDSGQVADVRRGEYAINASGQIGANLLTPGGDSVVIRNPDGSTSQASGFVPNDYLKVADINNAGLVVGQASAGNGIHPFLFDGTRMTDLGVLPGSSGAAAYAVNNAGVVVGGAIGHASHAFSWASGKLSDLGTLGNVYDDAAAWGINDAGQIVGFSTVRNSMHAFLYEGGRMLDLNDLVSLKPGLTLLIAQGIDNQGDILVTGEQDNRHVALLLRPLTVVPEPGGLTMGLSLLAACGAASVLARARRLLRSRPAAALLAALIGCGTAGASSIRYTATDLGEGFGIREATPTGISPDGHIVGVAWGEQKHGFMYFNGTYTDLGSSLPRAVNNAGQIASANRSEAAINASGQTVGTQIGELAAPFIKDVDGSTVLVDAFSGARGSGGGWGINASGQVVGYFQTPNGGHPFLYDHGKTIDLGMPTNMGSRDAEAFGINDSGVIVGAVIRGDLAHAFSWADGKYSDLGTLERGAGNSVAWAINNSGQIVGWSSMNGSLHAFVYRNGRMEDLNDLIAPLAGLTLTGAYGIDDRGDIIARATQGDENHALLLRPLTVVPEPGGLTIGVAIVVLAGIASRIKRVRIPAA